MKARNRSNLIKVAALVIACVPASLVSAQEKPKSPPADDMKALGAKPTPKTSDGRPDLNGHWVAPNTGKSFFGGRIDGNVHDLYYGDLIPGANPDTDAILTEYGDPSKGGGTGEDRRKARESKNKPSYKPEFQAKVEMMGKDPNHYDPTTYSCLPVGVPRIGAPSMIMETPGSIVLLYGGGYGTPSPYSTYRVVPTDGREHRKGTDYDPTPMGDPVGHWEGDTLVIDTTGFDDSTWFGSDGYFHTAAMHVIERITRKGDTLEYSATVDDPNVLTKPFNLNPTPLTLKIGGSNDILYNSDYPCDVSGSRDFREHADHENHL
jgi:hypothetical protein